MVTMHYFEKLRTLVDEGLSNAEISRRLKIHRSTVSKYRALNTPPNYKTRQKSTRDNPLEDFESDITEWLTIRPNMSGTSVYLHIKDKGYTGSLRTVERRIAELRASKPKERFFEQEYTPGEQAQFDFKEKVAIAFKDGERICQIFIGTLPYSGRFFAKGFPNKTYEAFADGIHSFFEAIGGMTDKIRFDNLSPAVKKVLKGSDRIYTDAFDRALKYYGVTPLPCSPGKGNEKGDCERDIRTFAHRIKDMLVMSGRVFTDYDDLNIWLGSFSLKQLTETQKNALEEERTKLKNLPVRDESILCQVHVTTVNKHGTICLSRTRYSVPDTAIGRQVKVIVSPFDVKIYQISPSKKLIASHPRIPENQSSILLEHTITSLVRKPQAMVRWAHKEILFPHKSLEKYYSYLKKILPYGAEAEFLKSLNLIHHSDLQDIVAGVEIIIEMKSRSPFFDLKELLLKPGLQQTVCLGELARCQPPLNTGLSQYDSLIPA